MTQAPIEKPVNTQLRANGLAKPQVATAEFLRYAAIEPVPTVWGRPDGRPIYDRLPAIEQAYVKGYEKGQAYVYLDETTGNAFGPGSLSVGALTENPGILAVENGKITWVQGTVSVDAYEVNLRALNFGKGLPDGEYQIGYQLTYEPYVSDSPVPNYELKTVEDAPLFDAAILIAGSSFAPGHEPFHAVSEVGSWWPNNSRGAGNYDPGSWLVLDYEQPVVADKFTVVGDENVEDPTASMAVYYSDDAIVWYAVDTQVTPVDGKWECTTDEAEPHRYWRFFFWDGQVSVGQLLYSGQAYFQNFTSSGPVTNATPYLDDIYADVEGEYILLATFTVVDGDVGTVADLRNITTTPYEPVADWLTDFQDQNLRCLFDDVERYSTKFLAPTTADYHYYDELDDSVCSGSGEFELGLEERGEILFPDIVEAICSDVDPTCLLTPDQVILLKDPATPSDMATVAYTQFELTSTWSLDNGFY